jgi:hypothetical protein
MNSDLLLPLTPSQKPLPDANSPFVATAAAVQDENNENLINTVKRRELLEYDAVDHANTTKRKLPACGETGASGKKTPAGKRIKICEWLDVDKGKVLFPEQKLGLENHPQTIKGMLLPHY